MVPLVVLVAWPSGLVAVVVAVGVVVAVAVVVAVGWSVVVAGVGGGCSVPARGTMTTSEARTVVVACRLFLELESALVQLS